MGDTWEDWDSEEEIPVPAPILARSATNADKFADEDAEVTDGPKWEGTVPEQKEVRSIALINPMDVRAGVETLGVARSPAGGFNRSFSRIQSLGRIHSLGRSRSLTAQLRSSLPQKKVVVSKYDESRGVQKPRGDDEPLDDPIAEKLRQQRLVEEADYAATMELFGNSRDLDGFIPKTNKEFEELGKLVAAKHLIPHASAKGYKSAIKSLLHAALHEVSAADVKDLETCVAGIRSERMKAEKSVAAMGKKQIKKASLNTGMKTKGTSAGLDDVVYDDDLGDDFDFM